MAKNNVSTSGKLVAAAGGNNNLLEVLRQVTANLQLQQQVTSTAAKNVPPQASAQVSYLQGNYIVQITNPGGVSPVSSLQSAQQTQGQTSAANTAAITPIYHQVRVSGSPRFDIAGNVQTFGGTTGSTQTFWTLTNLGSGSFYFQIRSSYDGVNFNLWKNANGGRSLTSRPESVTVETVTNGVFGVFELAGGQLVAVGAGFCEDEGTFTLPDYLYSSAMAAIPGPNGYTEYGHDMHSIKDCSIGILTPDSTAGLIGPADYPIEVLMDYQDGNNNIWPGSANWFAFAFDPLGTNVSLQEYSTGNWSVFNMAGGWQLAIGSGKVASGGAFTLPPGFSASDMLAICSPNDFTDAGHQAHGISNGSVTGNTVTMQYSDGSGDFWTTDANWFAVAWSPGVAATTEGAGTFLVFTAPSGSKICFGAGVAVSGTAITLPPGFTAAQMLSMVTPNTYTDTGHPAHGVEECAMTGLTPTLTYTDGSDNSWSGSVNWMVFAWQ